MDGGQILLEIMLQISIFFIAAGVLYSTKSVLGKKGSLIVCALTYIASYIIFYDLFREVYRAPGYTLGFGVKGLGGDAILLNIMTLYVALMGIFISNMIMFHAILFEKQPNTLTYASMLAAAGSTLGVFYSNNLIMIAIFWEALVVSIVGILYDRDYATSTEAVIKMLFMSLLGSTMFFLGIGLLYVSVAQIVPTLASLNLSTLTDILGSVDEVGADIALLSLAFMVSGIGVEVGLAPFHMWLPDVYSGTRACSAAFVFSLEDTAGLWLLLRVLSAYSRVPIGPVFYALTPAFVILAVFSVLSISIGELSALSQNAIRRLLGYSSIADAGYVLLLISYIVYSKTNIFTGAGMVYAAPAAYFIVFSIMSLTTSLALMGVMEEVGIKSLDTIRGAVARVPLLTLLLLISILSVAGVPPLSGFIAKLMMLSFLTASREVVSILLAITATLFFVVCAAYMLRVVQRATLEKSEKMEREEICVTPLVPLIVLVSIIVLAGCVPTLFIPPIP